MFMLHETNTAIQATMQIMQKIKSYVHLVQLICWSICKALSEGHLDANASFVCDFNDIIEA